MEKVVTRFPPSPTGPFHIGNARTALFNYLFTKQNHGKMIFRLEDTDKERSKKEYEEDIIENLKWLGIELDFKNFPRQSERSKIYKKYLQKLLDGNKAYLDGKAVRFKNPNKKVKFEDLIHGEIEFDTTELKDFVIAKNLEEPIYHLAVVVDDFEMGVTHVIRGEDHISNTPRQILIQEAIARPGPFTPICRLFWLQTAPNFPKENTANQFLFLTTEKTAICRKQWLIFWLYWAGIRATEQENFQYGRID